MTVHYFDGPTKMNNKPRGLDLHGHRAVESSSNHLLNFFGITFFLLIFPASYYWEKVEAKKNEVEEKFPDFFVTLPNIGKEVFL